MLDICIKNVDKWQYYSYRKQGRPPPVPSRTLYASITDGYEKTLETSHLARKYCFVFSAVGNDCPTLTPFLFSWNPAHSTMKRKILDGGWMADVGKKS